MRTPTIHQAGNKDFDPANYVVLGVSDLDEQGDGGMRGTCAHCGHMIRYAAELIHKSSNEKILIGETCLDSRFEITRAEFDALREQGRLNRHRASLNERKASFLAQFPEVQTILDRREDHGILFDLAYKFETNAELSPRQLELAKKLYVQVDEYNARKALRDAADAELIAKGVEVPEGRVTVTGTVLSTKWEETEWGFSAKMLVQDDAGWRVWVSIPNHRDLANNTRVKFSAQITRKDQLFGFGKRPTKFFWFDAEANDWTDR